MSLDNSFTKSKTWTNTILFRRQSGNWRSQTATKRGLDIEFLPFFLIWRSVSPALAFLHPVPKTTDGVVAGGIWAARMGVPTGIRVRIWRSKETFAPQRRKTSNGNVSFQFKTMFLEQTSCVLTFFLQRKNFLQFLIKIEVVWCQLVISKRLMQLSQK